MHYFRYATVTSLLMGSYLPVLYLIYVWIMSIGDNMHFRAATILVSVLVSVQYQTVVSESVKFVIQVPILLLACYIYVQLK